MIKVALDAMGGDNAPGEIVKGAVDAVNTSSECFVYLVGQEEAVKAELAKYTYNEKQIEVVNATEVIETGEPPVMAIRRKKDSSIVKALNMVKKKEADAFVSAGSSGAILVGGQVIVGRLPGVERPPIGAIVPTDKGCVLIVDSGANVDARPAFLVQWAKMGSIYMENCVGIKNPRVGIFENVVSQLAIIVCFQSLILDMAGNVGTQSLAVTIRVLMDEDISAKQKFEFVLKEMRIGFANGLLLGSMAFLLLGIYIMVVKGKPWHYAFAISGCVGASLLLAMLISSLIGVLTPMFFHKIKIDPAVASGPLITTINDLVAVVTYYGLAAVVLIGMLHITG